MQDSKLSELQKYLQKEVDTAWTLTKNSHFSPYENPQEKFGKHLEFLMQSNNLELSLLLDDLAMEEYNSLENEQTPPRINFEKYIRYSNRYPNHKEVFVGDKWIIVPGDSCIEFGTLANGFKVSVSSGSDYATFTTTQTLQKHNEELTALESSGLTVTLDEEYISKDEFDWINFGEQAFNKTKDARFFLDDAATVYLAIPNEFKRQYAYKISKIAKSVSKLAKAGKIFQGGQKLAKLGKTGKALGVLGTALSIGTIGYEIRTDNWDAHTAVDGALLVVGVGAAVFGAPVVLVGIAVYGVLDYFFDFSEGIDSVVGRDSGLWNGKPIREYPIQSKLLLFNKIKIDNTRVDMPKLKMPPKFKNK